MIIYITCLFVRLFLSYRNGTSMISLVKPPKDQVSRISKMLADEYGTASNIKSRVNRYVISSILYSTLLFSKNVECIYALTLLHFYTTIIILMYRLSVLGAITSTQQKLKLYTRVPDNGLVLYCGTILTDDGKEKRVNIDFEPFKPINTSLYLCDNKFHTEVCIYYYILLCIISLLIILLFILL